ncbi:aspartic peptidase domain-containing protein [Dactylonectria macrodidyma]|uniref:Aspartic peptidase domain-containing protein n=1 Tax=Dactylonectria macrodidyma TaxID=307937 RepID=A0A9P9DP48_9HYPO|nr:aspartic peptidase domain-containing protein [Dactylonectria macrodidyma]
MKTVLAIFLALSGTFETISALSTSSLSRDHVPLEPRGVLPIKQIITNENDDPSSQSYTIRVKLGTPPQILTLALESSQSDTWLTTGCPDGNVTCNYLSFKTKKSKSLSRALGKTQVHYGDPTTIPPSNDTIDLVYHEDVLAIAGVTISRQRFGLSSPDVGPAKSAGLIGLGPNINLGYRAGKPYNTILDSLAAKGAIASRTFSLRTGTYNDKHGAIIWGGANTGGFRGKLVKRPLVKDELGTFGPSIALTGLAQKSSKRSRHSYTVKKSDSVFLLDTGNQYLRLRHSFVDPLLKDMGAVNDGNDAYFVPCSKRSEPGSWDFTFGDVTIKVPYSEIITELTDNSGRCWVGVLVTWKGQLVLGLPFMRSAYLAFDYDNKVVGLAQPANCPERLVAFGKGRNAIPSNLHGC